MDIKELKAEAYDLLALIERAKAKLQQVNQSIATESQKPKEPKGEDGTPKV